MQPAFGGYHIWRMPMFLSLTTANFIVQDLRWSHATLGRCCCSVPKSCMTRCNPMDCSSQSSLSVTIFWSLPKFMSIELMMPLKTSIHWCSAFLLSNFHIHTWLLERPQFWEYTPRIKNNCSSMYLVFFSNLISSTKLSKIWNHFKFTSLFKKYYRDPMYHLASSPQW